LQQQVATLQAQQEKPETVLVGTTGFESFIFDSTHDIEARYQLDSPEAVSRITDDTHRIFFTRFFDIVPDAYDDYFIDLVVYNDRESPFEGFVETVPPYRADTWRLGLNSLIFDFAVTAHETTELFIHEFSHIVSYEVIPGRLEPANSTCHALYDDFGCPPANSFLADFTEEFWPERALDALLTVGTGETLWSQRDSKEQFVSEYASSHPAEDFAESFTVFVLADRPTGARVFEQKVEYFYQFEKLIDLRNAIRDQL
jgi:hypothetical protein